MHATTTREPQRTPNTQGEWSEDRRNPDTQAVKSTKTTNSKIAMTTYNNARGPQLKAVTTPTGMHAATHAAIPSDGSETSTTEWQPPLRPQNPPTRDDSETSTTEWQLPLRPQSPSFLEMACLGYKATPPGQKVEKPPPLGLLH